MKNMFCHCQANLYRNRFIHYRTLYNKYSLKCKSKSVTTEMDPLIFNKIALLRVSKITHFTIILQLLFHENEYYNYNFVFIVKVQ